MPSASPKLNILIIGGGIGGFATAIPLARAGHRVTVYESRPELTQIGGAIAVAPNGVRCLADWGLEDKLRPFAQHDMAMTLRRWDNDEVIANARQGKKETSGFAHHDLKRATLQSILYDGAVDAGAKIEFGKKVKSVDTISGRVVFADGSEIQGDIVVGADGVNSIVRSCIFPDQDIAHARASPDCFYLVELVEESLRSNPALTSVMDRPFMSAWMGPEHCIVVGTAGRAFMSHAVFSAHGSGDVGEWNDSITLAELQRKFSGFGPVAKGILASGKGCYKWKIAEVGPLPTWSDGKAVLLGDAAHAMYPTRGQGATQTIEDAACLGECINAAMSHEDLPRLLAIYEQQRKRRVQAIAASANQNFKGFVMPDGPGQQARDQRMRENEQKGREAAQQAAPQVSLKANDIPESGAGFDVWVLRYNVIKDTKEALGAV